MRVGHAWECRVIVAAILLVTGSQMRTVASRLQLTRPTSGTEPTCVECCRLRGCKWFYNL